MWKSRTLQSTIKISIKILNYDIIWNLSVDTVDSNHCIDSCVVSCLIIKMSWFIINSDRDGQLLIVDNFIHRVDRIRGSNHYYKCIDNCGGRATYYREDSDNAIMSKTHGHPTHGIQLAERGFRNKLKVSLF